MAPMLKFFNQLKGMMGVFEYVLYIEPLAIWATIFLKLYYYYSIVDLFSIEK